MRSGNYFVARFDAKGVHRDMECIRSVGARNAMLDTYRISKFPLELFNIWPPYKRGIPDYILNCSINFRLYRTILSVEIGEGYLNCHDGYEL